MRRVCLLVVVAMLAIGCRKEDETVEVFGAVVMGPVSGSVVTFFSLNADGGRGDQLGFTATDASGTYSCRLDHAWSSPILAESSGGIYTDESTGGIVDLAVADKLMAVLPVGVTNANITPLTHIAAVRALALAKDGGALSTAVDSSNTGVASQFGVKNIIETLSPAADNADSVGPAALDQRIYALVLAGLSQEANQIGVRAMDLTGALAEDAKDGRFDGTNNGAAISVPTVAGTSITLSATAGTTDIQTAINAFIASTRNQTHVTEVDVALTPVSIGINTTFNGWLYSNTTVLPARKSGEGYEYALSAKGGTEPYSCALKAGSALPDGFSLSNTCVITGIAITAASTTISAPFTVTLSDSSAPPKAIDLPPLRITTVRAGPTIVPLGGNCSEGEPCNVTVAMVTGGEPPYYFTSDPMDPAPLGLMIYKDGTVKGTLRAKCLVACFFGICVVDNGGMSACTTDHIGVTEKSNPPPSSSCPVFTKDTCCTSTMQGVAVVSCYMYTQVLKDCFGGKCPAGTTQGADGYVGGTTLCTCP